MGKPIKSTKASPPAYMVSFCDMMTLILTFFILLVSLAKEQQVGLLANGVGSFIVAVKSFGLNGVLSGQEKQEVFEHVRRKFNVPSDAPEDQLVEAEDASRLELLRTRLLDSLQPHDQLTYPAVIEFPAGAAVFPAGAEAYLDMLAPSLHPKHHQLLVIEGHANDAGPEFAGDDPQLAAARAMVVRDYLIERFGFPPERVEARAWHEELPMDGQDNRSVDIRLLTPGAPTAENE